jgi:uncharacterized protein involved in response to NO
MSHCSTISKPYDPRLTRLLVAFVAAGLLFMAGPGIVIGAMNLTPVLPTPPGVAGGWVQAHGHALLFGWLGSFILGISFYVIPRMRGSDHDLTTGWITWGLWIGGVTLRLLATNSGVAWKTLLPISAFIQLAAISLFFISIFRGRGDGDGVISLRVIRIGAAGWLLLMGLNLYLCVQQATAGMTPVISGSSHQFFIFAALWGFLVPLTLGYAARWLPAVLNLRPAREGLMLPAIASIMAGVLVATTGAWQVAALVWAVGTIGFIIALRLFEPLKGKPRLRGIHPWSIHFIRLATVWLTLAAALMVPFGNSFGWPDFLRHLVTVGFLVTMVLAVGPRMLPALFGRAQLFSRRLMLVSLLLVSAGVSLRLVLQLAGQAGMDDRFWIWFPYAAALEGGGIIVFAANMLLTLSIPVALAPRSDVPAGNLATS